ncbi:MAG: hypothetical protein CFK48_09690, partial [Armatimonadetes bacterium CP1_7O]
NANSQVRLTMQGATVQGKAELVTPIKTLPMSFPLQLTAERATLTLHLLIYHCREGQEGLCYLYEKHLTLPIQQGTGADTVPVEVVVE